LPLNVEVFNLTKTSLRPAENIANTGANKYNNGNPSGLMANRKHAGLIHQLAG